jgi:hypothetical protein
MTTEDRWKSEFDDLLEQELERSVGHLQGPRTEFYQSAYYKTFLARGNRRSAFSALPAAGFTKAAAGLGAAALVAAGGTVVAIASTGSADPGVWGKTVSAAVASCKDQRTEGQHGIGQCVSAVAKEKGEQQRALHSASAARENHQGTPTGQNHSTNSPTAVPAGQAKSHPTGSPTSVPPGQAKSHPGGPAEIHPTGRPSGVPVGPPANLPAASPGTHPTGPPVSPPPHP